jgi:hypothetical protein
MHFKLLYIVKMADTIDFTLGIQACISSDPFKLLVNMFSTLYTGWLSEQNIANVVELFTPCKYITVMEKVLSRMKDKNIIDNSVTELSVEDTIRGAIELLGGRAIREDECQYITEILVVIDLYMKNQLINKNVAFKKGSRKVKSDERSKTNVLLPDGMFGVVGNQNDFINIASNKHDLGVVLKRYGREIVRLGLSRKIPSIRIIYPNNNYGIAMMRTITLQACRGKMLAMIDDDDISCGIDSLHRIGRTMLEQNKYVAEVQSWWNPHRLSTIGTGMWERVFDAQALKHFGIGFCPTFSMGEDTTFLELLRMLFDDKFIIITTDGNVIDDAEPYPRNIDLKYLYLNPSNSWEASSVTVTGELQKEETSLYIVQVCKQLGIYDTLSKAIPSDRKCNGPISYCAGYKFIHTADEMKSSQIISTNDVICPIYQFKLEGENIVKDGDNNVKYIWALPSPETEEIVSFSTNITADEAIKKNVIDFNLGEYIKYNDEGNLVVTGKLRPRSSSINDATGVVSYNGVEMSWVDWNNNIYDELIKEFAEGKGAINARTKLRGGANRSYIMLILLALALILLIIIPIICKCICSKNNRSSLSHVDE